MIEDEVHYAAPFGVLGELAQPLLIERDLRRIFDYRQQAVGRIFGEEALASGAQPCSWRRDELAAVAAARSAPARPPGADARPRGADADDRGVLLRRAAARRPPSPLDRARSSCSSRWPSWASELQGQRGSHLFVVARRSSDRAARRWPSGSAPPSCTSAPTSARSRVAASERSSRRSDELGVEVIAASRAVLRRRAARRSAPAPATPTRCSPRFTATGSSSRAATCCGCPPSCRRPAPAAASAACRRFDALGLETAGGRPGARGRERRPSRRCSAFLDGRVDGYAERNNTLTGQSVSRLSPVPALRLPLAA